MRSIWRSYVDCQRIAISNRTSTKLSATVLFADYAARAVNDVYSQRRTCLSRKPWKLPRAWRQRTVMQNLSKDPLLQYTRFDHCQRHKNTNRRTRQQQSIPELHVTVVVDQTTIRRTAGFEMLLVTTATKRDISNGKTLTMEIDTGASVSIISEQLQKQLFPKASVEPSPLQLQTYTGERLGVIGQTQVTVRHHAQEKQLTIHIVSGSGPSLLGRDWLKHIQLDWKTIGEIHMQRQAPTLQGVLMKYLTFLLTN